MLNFYGRKYPRNIKNDQLKKLYDFNFFLDKRKIKTLCFKRCHEYRRPWKKGY